MGVMLLPDLLHSYGTTEMVCALKTKVVRKKKETT